MFKIKLNPYHAEFLKWNNPSYIFGTVHYLFKGYRDENLKLVIRAVWPGSILVAKATYFRCWQGKG